MSLALQELFVTLAAMVQCFNWDVTISNCRDMAERPGLTAPRATDLICMPVARTDMVDILHEL